MDAYDIFKKLSQGAKFKRKNPFSSVANNAVKKIKQETKNFNTDYEPDTNIKEEPLDNGYVASEINRDVNGINNDENKIQSENESTNRELTLLGSITATDSGKKVRKTKVFDEKKLLMLEQEKINQFRNQHHINVVGRHIPSPIKEFKELEIGADLIENLTKSGYETPTKIQMQTIPVMLQCRQILGCAPTGSGKTAAFLLPILHRLQEPQRKGFRAVIVCPTRELARQTQKECMRLGDGRGFRVHVINKIKQAIRQFGPNSNQKFDILVTTPNRLCYLLNQDPPAVSLANVEWLIVDEADKLFEEGLQGFRNQLDQIMAACTSKQLQIAMFSATLTVDVNKWCRRNMRGLINVTIGQRNSATDLVEQELLFVGSESGKLVAFRNIIRKGLAPPVLVFVQSKDRAQQLFNELIYDGINVDAIHADRSQTQRDNTVRSFREGKIWVLICTELMARGIDFKGVHLVINYDFPPSAISYVHRVGRAGRAGRRGKAITFFTTDDTQNLRSIANVLRQSGCEVPDYMVAMKKRRSKIMKDQVIERDDITTKPKFLREKYEKKQNQYVRPLSTKEDSYQNVDDMLQQTMADNSRKMEHKSNMKKRPEKLKKKLAKSLKKQSAKGGKKLGTSKLKKKEKQK